MHDLSILDAEECRQLRDVVLPEEFRRILRVDVDNLGVRVVHRDLLQMLVDNLAALKIFVEDVRNNILAAVDYREEFLLYNLHVTEAL